MRHEWEREIRRNVNVDQSIANLPPSNFYADQSNGEMLDLVVSDYLSSSGYLETLVFRRPQRNGLPIPWFTFPSIEYLESLDLSAKTVVEIGSGYSTLYWARRGMTGVSYEANAEWISMVLSAQSQLVNGLKIDVVSLEEIASNASSNVTEFPKEISRQSARDLAMFDIEVDQRRFGPGLAAQLVQALPAAHLVVVDGVLRNMCMTLAAELCPPTCKIVVDNSERSEYSTGASQLLEFGWRPTTFSGLGPLNPYEWTTTVWSQA